MLISKKKNGDRSKAWHIVNNRIAGFGSFHVQSNPKSGKKQIALIKFPSYLDISLV
jgi:hypothetical protein